MSEHVLNYTRKTCNEGKSQTSMNAVSNWADDIGLKHSQIIHLFTFLHIILGLEIFV